MLKFVLEKKYLEGVVHWPPAALPDLLTPGTQQPGKVTPFTLSFEHWPAASAQVLPLYIPHALDIVKILLDAFGKLCRTWLILDSAFPKFILSIRSLPDFILGPKTLFAFSVYIFLTKKVL